MKKPAFKKCLLLLAASLVCLLSLFEKDSLSYSPLVKYEEEMPDAGLSLHAIDVSQGSSTLIKADGCCVLIDTGERCRKRELLNYLKGEKVRQLDILFITHPHSDHYGAAIDLADEINVKKAVLPSLPSNIAADDILWEDMLSKLVQCGTELVFAEQKQEYLLSDNVKIELLGPFIKEPQNLNEVSLCFKISFGNTSFLITGDGEKQVEQALLDEDIAVDVLFAGHHGSKTSSREEFLEKAGAACSLISVGKDNPHGLPDRVVLDRLSKYGDIFRTDLDGSVVFLSDGENIKVIKEK